MLERMCRKGNTPPLLVGVSTCTATLEISMVNPQNNGNQSMTRSHNSTLKHIPKRSTIIQQGHLFNDVHSSTICNSQKLETTSMPLNGRMDRENVVHVHMEYYSAEKNNGILKFAGKWMDLEETILSEVTQSQKDKHGIISGF